MIAMDASLTAHTRGIALKDVSARQSAHRGEAPYQLFVAAELTLAPLGGFMLALLLPIAGAVGRTSIRQFTVSVPLIVFGWASHT
jgi:hypothetical protein